MEFKEKKPLYLLKEIAAILRGKNGCAWDIAQTSKTLKPYLIEEAYEVYEAIEKDNKVNLCEELGDLLYQVYAHSQIADENGHFDIDDVASGIVQKLIKRHPHVFGDEKVKNKEEVIEKWEKLKRLEKSHRESILDGVPGSLPSLLKAYRVQQKVSRVGFDWDNINDVLIKLREEVEEFSEAVKSSDPDRISDEVGDILFSIVNISRFINVNPDDALSGTVNKFIKRFKYIEKEAAASGQNLDSMTLDEMDRLWELSKKNN